MAKPKALRVLLTSKARLGNVGIDIPQPRNCSKLQQDVISLLTATLHECLSKVLNYEHVRLAIPKSKVPIVYRRHEYDIACLIREHVVLVDVFTIPTSYWTRRKDPKSGKGKI